MDSPQDPTRIPFFLPLIVGVTENEERVVLINPIAQTMMVLGSMLNGAEGKTGQPPAAKSAVEAMQRVEIKEGEEAGECAICLEEYKVGTTVKKMPCQHGFHEGCIEKWLGLHGSCPVCRYVMPVEEGDDVDKKGGGDDVEEREGGGGGGGERGRVSLEFFIRVGFGGRRRTSGDDDDGDDADDQDDD